jgi:L-rhamnose mutarotase
MIKETKEKRKESKRLYFESEWTKVDSGIKFEKVSDSTINSVIESMWGAWNAHLYGSHTKEEAEEYKQQVFDKNLAKHKAENILNTIDFLKSKTNHLLTYTEKGYRHSMFFKFASKPFVKYSHRARWTESNRNSRPIAKFLRTWEGRVENHWTNRANVLDSITKEQHNSRISLLSRHAKSRKDSMRYILDKRSIRTKLISTLESFTKGESNSTHGDWSFSLKRCTEYIDDNMEIIPFDLDSNTESLHKMCEYEKLTEYYKGKADVYINQILNYERKAHKASQDWLSVMKPIYDKIRLGEI